ncbi:hypothetical protein EA796_19710 [Pseudomonas sp. AOB-7]|nr:hypothetical protein EA796_19710 [Pseudomonas sp. AOB-7]
MPNNALNCRSLRSLDVQKLRFWPPVSLIVVHLERGPKPHAEAHNYSRSFSLAYYWCLSF